MLGGRVLTITIALLFGSPSLIILTLNKLMYFEPRLNNFPAIYKVILIRPLRRFLGVCSNAGFDMAMNQSVARNGKVDIHKPQLIHELGGIAPGRFVQGTVVALENDYADGGRNGNVVVNRVFDGMVEAWGVQRRCLWEYGFPELLNELVEGLAVECKGCTAASMGGVWIGHGIELGT